MAHNTVLPFKLSAKFKVHSFNRDLAVSQQARREPQKTCLLALFSLVFAE